jgi:hypothetical protein
VILIINDYYIVVKLKNLFCFVIVISIILEFLFKSVGVGFVRLCGLEVEVIRFVWIFLIFRKIFILIGVLVYGFV